MMTKEPFLTNSSMKGFLKMIIRESAIGSEDLDTVLDIWLQANIDAHDFISKEYWEKNVEYVKNELSKVPLFLYRNEKEIVAFLGLVNDYIAGIFVKREYRGYGIGGKLLEEAKKESSTLTLSVYTKNRDALNFYLSKGFLIEQESLDSATKELEYLMSWK